MLQEEKMPDILDKAFKDLQKSLQKVSVMNLAIDTNSAKIRSKKQIKKQVQDEKEITRKTLAGAKKILETAVQGEFGKKIDDALEKQAKLMDKL